MTGGAFHGGVLAALHDSLGWDARSADIVVGTSAGSLAGAVLRAGLAPADLLARSVGDPLSAEGLRVMRGMAAPASGFPLRPDTRAGAGAAGGAGGVGLGTASVPLSRVSAASVVRMAMRPWDVRPAAIVAALLPPGRVSTSMITGGIEPLFGTSWPAAPLWVCAHARRSAKRSPHPARSPGTSSR